jgi:hypothetical protein
MVVSIPQRGNFARYGIKTADIESFAGLSYVKANKNGLFEWYGHCNVIQ